MAADPAVAHSAERAERAERAEATPGTIRPGGRTERNRQAVAAAALALLRRGRIDLSPALVAEEAGVSRSTVHRRWPTRSDLLREAMALHTRKLRIPDTGALDSDIRTLARRLARFFSDPTEVARNVAMTAHTDPDFNAWQVEYFDGYASDVTRPFERAIARGEIASDIDVAMLLELLITPMVVRTAVLKQELTSRFIASLADHIIRLARMESSDRSVG